MQCWLLHWHYRQVCLRGLYSMIEYFCPILEPFAHFSYKLPGWISFCHDGDHHGVSFCPQYHYQPLFFTQPSQNPFGDMYEHKTPPPQNTPFPGLILKVGKMNYCLGKLGKMFEKWAKLFLKWAKRNIHLYGKLLCCLDSPVCLYDLRSVYITSESSPSPLASR